MQAPVIISNLTLPKLRAEMEIYDYWQPVATTFAQSICNLTAVSRLFCGSLGGSLRRAE